jgi:hypothetical protein
LTDQSLMYIRNISLCGARSNNRLDMVDKRICDDEGSH